MDDSLKLAASSVGHSRFHVSRNFSDIFSCQLFSFSAKWSESP